MTHGPALWSYWDDAPGSTRSGYLELCEQTQRRHAGRLPFRLVSADDAEDWVGPLRPEVHSLGLAHRADYVRVRLLLQHGGVWLDADTIALRPVDELFDLLGPGDQFVGYGEDSVHIGTFAAPAGSAVLSEWAAAQDAVIDATDNLAALEWTALGSTPLQPILDQHQWHRVDDRRIAPLDWNDWRVLLSVTQRAKPILDEDPIAVALFNSRLHEHISNRSARRIRLSPMLLSRILRVGLGILDPASPDGLLTRFESVGRFNRYRRRRREVRRRVRAQRTAPKLTND